MSQHSTCMMKRAAALVAMIAAAMPLSATLALAHHPMGGATPSTFWHGFLSGIGHPVIGLDHFAFVIAAGIASALVGSRLMLPALFIAATIVGCLATVVAGAAPPAAEYVIAGSVLLIGAIVMVGATVDTRVLGAMFAVAGLFHGSAYAASIVGAEPTPLVAYLIGFGLLQFALMAGAAMLTRIAGTPLATEPRLAGAFVAGIGATFMVEHIESVLFAGL